MACGAIRGFANSIVRPKPEKSRPHCLILDAGPIIGLHELDPKRVLDAPLVLIYGNHVKWTGYRK